MQNTIVFENDRWGKERFRDKKEKENRKNEDNCFKKGVNGLKMSSFWVTGKRGDMIGIYP